MYRAASAGGGAGLIAATTPRPGAAAFGGATAAEAGGCPPGDAASSYVLLAVGDALVAQIPGLLISVAAAMVVSRVGKEQDVGAQIMGQMFENPKVMGVAAGILGMLGDRAARDERMVPVPLLGKPALLPAGPLQLAAVLGAPVVLCAGFWLGPRRYRLVFEPFAERITLDRARREEALQEWLTRYAAWVERCCRAHPFNWFNFFDVWRELDE